MKRIEDVKEYNKEVRRRNKEEIRVLENSYVQDVVENLDSLIAERKEKLIKDLLEYKGKFGKEDKRGNYEIDVEPMVINKYFFKPINPLVGSEPTYNAEKLGIVWEIYSDTVATVSENLRATVVPTLSNFCRFAGIRLSTFRNYKNSSDESMRIVTEKIEDECFDTNVTLAQMGKVKETSTQYRMKAEQGKVEAQAPSVHIHAESIDLGAINDRIKDIMDFNNRKNQVIEGSKVDE